MVLVFVSVRSLAPPVHSLAVELSRLCVEISTLSVHVSTVATCLSREMLMVGSQIDMPKSARTISEALRTHILHRYKCLNKCPLFGGFAQAYTPLPWRWRCSPTQQRVPLL